MQINTSLSAPWVVLATDRLSTGQTIKVVTEDLKLVLDGSRAKRFDSREDAEAWLERVKPTLAGKHHVYTVMML